MLPWNYGFHGTTAQLIFLGAFYAVLAVVATTVFAAVRRSRRALRADEAESIRWHSDFHDLLPAERACRHELTGEFQHRECPHAFDCRQCETHSKLVASRTVEPPDDDEPFGLAFPQDRYYHRGHTWARPEADGAVTVGLDDLAQRLIGQPDGLELPQLGARLQVNGTAWRARKREADIRLLSPVDGEVVAVGAPGCDWVLKVRPLDGHFDLRHLLHGAEVRAWLLREMERMQLALTAEGAAAQTLADGGVPVPDIAANYPDVDWDAVCGRMFLEP